MNGGTWLRFMFRLEDPADTGKLGWILAKLFGDCTAFFVEPWPENDRALYVRNEGDNRARVVELAKEAGLRPVAFKEVASLEGAEDVGINGRQATAAAQEYVQDLSVPTGRMD